MHCATHSESTFSQEAKSYIAGERSQIISIISSKMSFPVFCPLYKFYNLMLYLYETATLIFSFLLLISLTLYSIFLRNVPTWPSNPSIEVFISIITLLISLHCLFFVVFPTLFVLLFHGKAFFNTCSFLLTFRSH